MEWTKTPPTQEGWYWYFGKTSHDTRITQVTQYGNYGPYIFLGHTRFSYKEAAAAGGYWYGPITPPAPPQEQANDI